LGFDVVDYANGKEDWFGADLPADGTRPQTDRIGAHAKPVPSFGLHAAVGDVVDAIRDGGWGFGVVVDDDGVVLGRLRQQDVSDAAASDPSTPAERIMKEGPSTYRPNVPVAELADQLREKNRDDALVTTSDGVLLGAVRRSSLETSR
jgi:CBS domain-containing protein